MDNEKVVIVNRFRECSYFSENSLYVIFEINTKPNVFTDVFFSKCILSGIQKLNFVLIGLSSNIVCVYMRLYVLVRM